MIELEELQKNYHGVYIMMHGVPILVTWDKLKLQPKQTTRRTK